MGLTGTSAHHIYPATACKGGSVLLKRYTPGEVGLGVTRLNNEQRIWSMSVAPPTSLPPVDWAHHQSEVTKCRGAACYAALAIHFGTDAPNSLEWRIDRKKDYEYLGERSQSNKYRRWRQGTIPKDETVAHVFARSGGSVRLDFWRDLPLWELLSPAPPAIHRIHRLLEAMPLAIRRNLFMYELPNSLGRYHHSLLERGQVLAIRDIGTLDAFIALLCLARKGEVLEHDPQHFLPSVCAFDIFPRVISAHSPLRYRWEDLFTCLDRVFWKRDYSTGMRFSFSIERSRAALNLLLNGADAEIPYMSGHVLRAPKDSP